MKSLKKRTIFRAIICAGIALLCSGASPVLVSQENLGRGRIFGTVVDESGNPVEGALIVAESLQASVKLEGTSDSKGHFAIAGLGTGGWKVTGSKKGFVDSSIQMNIRQLVANPPITLTLKKITGGAAFLSDKAAMELFDKGNRLINEGKYDEALQAFEEFLAKYPEIYQVHLNIGSCYQKKGDLARTEDEYKLVLDKTLKTYGSYKRDAATTIRAFSGLGELYLKKGDFDAAEKSFRQALEISPEDEVAAYNVGGIMFSNQKVDEAIKYFELAIQIKKDWSKPYYKLGVVYLNKGDFAKSLEYLNKFIQMDPQNPEVPTVRNMIEAIEKIKK